MSLCCSTNAPYFWLCLYTPPTTTGRSRAAQQAGTQLIEQVKQRYIYKFQELCVETELKIWYSLWMLPVTEWTFISLFFCRCLMYCTQVIRYVVFIYISCLVTSLWLPFIFFILFIPRSSSPIADLNTGHLICITHHPVIRRCIVWVTKIASLNKLQIYLVCVDTSRIDEIKNL
jgi:hypothetical protein